MNTNIIRRDTMVIYSGAPTKEHVHYEEVIGSCSFLHTAKGEVAGYPTHINHAGDEDLQKLLEEAIRNGQEEIKQIEILLKDNGIGLPPTPPERPKAHLENIPTGARFQDPEIAASLSM